MTIQEANRINSILLWVSRNENEMVDLRLKHGLYSGEPEADIRQIRIDWLLERNAEMINDLIRR